MTLLGIKNERERLPRLNGQSTAVGVLHTRVRRLVRSELLQSDSEDDLAWISSSRYPRSVKTRSSMLGWSIVRSTSRTDAKQRVTVGCRKEGVHAPQHGDSEVPEDDSSNIVSAATFAVLAHVLRTYSLPNAPFVIALQVLLPPTSRSVR